MSVHANELIAEIRAMWDEWDLRDGVKDNMLEFDAFYNGFMAPYFGCYRCDETKKALKAIDMDNDGVVWKIRIIMISVLVTCEFTVYTSSC